MTDSPEMQKLLRGLENLKRDSVKATTDAIMAEYERGVVGGIEACLMGLIAARKASEEQGELQLIPGLDTAIHTLSLALEMAKVETNQ